MQPDHLVLGIETSGLMCSVAWWQNGRILLETNIEARNRHAELLPELIGNGFEYLSLKHSDIGLVCVAAGPGSFTGLRIGMAYAKGYCYAVRKPLQAVSNFHIMARCADKSSRRLIVLIDARRGRLYRAIINPETRDSEQADIISVSQLMQDLTDDTVIIKEKELALPEKIYLTHPIIENQITASEVCLVGHRQFVHGVPQPLEDIEPAYLQRFAGMT